jgi:5'(3')-deoxyribonucleotidase
MEKQAIFLDLDGVIADFAGAYKAAFNRSAHDDDPFTVQQFVMQVPDFFRILPVLEKGAELVDLLKDQYEVIFLTTPMEGVESCRRDKLEWVREHFGTGHDVLFSDDKAEFVMDEKSILIDDMQYNLKPWRDAGGTAIDFKQRNDAIIEKIEDVLSGKEAERVKKELASMDVEAEPSKKQKQSGNYRKGKIQFKGLDIRIENVPGSIRFGFDFTGRKWVSRMKNYYGYITGTEGADYDPVDVFIGPRLNASRVFVINQGKNGMFDEVKCMLGFEDVESAKQAYLSNYQKGQEKNIMSIVQSNTRKLREWVKLKSKDPFRD